MLTLHPPPLHFAVFDFAYLSGCVFFLMLGDGYHPAARVVVDREALAVQNSVLVTQETTPQRNSYLIVELKLTPGLWIGVVTVDALRWLH